MERGDRDRDVPARRTSPLQQPTAARLVPSLSFKLNRPAMLNVGDVITPPTSAREESKLSDGGEVGAARHRTVRGSDSKLADGDGDDGSVGPYAALPLSAANSSGGGGNSSSISSLASDGSIGARGRVVAGTGEPTSRGSDNGSVGSAGVGSSTAVRSRLVSKLRFPTPLSSESLDDGDAVEPADVVTVPSVR